MRRSTLVAALLLVFGLGLAWVLAVWSAEPERGGSPTLPAVTVTVSGGPGTSPAPPPPSGEPGNPAPTASPRAGGSGGAAGTPVTGSGPGSGGSQQHGTPARGKHVPDPQPQRGS